MTTLILLLPYLAIMLLCWDRKKTAMGVVLCLLLLVVELVVGAHLWAAFRV